MRTAKDLENMIDNTAKVRFRVKAGPGNATISAWPSPNVIYMHSDWFDEKKASDADVKECLLHELGHRNDWIFNGIGMLAGTGFYFMLAAVLWNLLAAPILNANLGTVLPIDKNWIAYGMAMAGIAILLRLALHDYLDRRADYFRRDMSA
ncbi:hypothetical protein [Acidithiobacillus thiooxidans]|uniref:hypothetical protein n=1 Tax=Acidithiobacillus thiooxidans TaxID=930 RepID=UPI0004E1FD44|nr:hypothetical protein [Acidithiobacillus thiooxidans]